MKQDIARTSEQAAHVERTTRPNQPHVRRLAKKVARKAKSREKKLDRYLASDERVEKPPLVWQMKLDFDNDTHIGRDVVRLEQLACGYPPGPPLLANLNLTIQAGQRVALTGQNGAGKTTLLKTIAGLLPPLAGEVRLGASVRIGYMSQEQELLDPTLTPLATIQRAAELSETEARSFLHYFPFEGDESLQPIRELSYGERRGWRWPGWSLRAAHFSCWTNQSITWTFPHGRVSSRHSASISGLFWRLSMTATSLSGLRPISGSFVTGRSLRR
ncbi:MAG: ATP-binding cassette domain-containing protein [Chloroflexota bacterium]